jgi:nicotinamidase-related amidase
VTDALLVIDMQMAQFSPAPYQGEQVAARIGELAARARAGGIPVFHIQHDGGSGDSFERGSPGWQFHPGVVPQGGDQIVEKTQGSAFHETDLHARLAALGIDRLVITGMKTQYCIDSACRAAAGLGYEVILVADAHTTADSETLSARQIIAHHNETLDGGYVQLIAARDVSFPPLMGT